MITSLNNALFSILADLTEVGVIATDEKGDILFFNKGAEQMLGYQQKEVLAANLSLFLNQISDKASYTDLRTGQIRTQTLAVENTHVFIAKNKKAVYVNLVVQHTFDHTESVGIYLYKFTQAHSITYQTGLLVPQAIIEKKPKSKQDYREFFDYTPFPMWVYNTDTLAFLDVNTAAIEQYGYSREQFLTMTLHDIRPKEDKNRLTHYFEFERGRFTPLTGWKHLRKNGQVIDVEISARNLPDKNGQNRRLIQAVDVTERKESEKNFNVLFLNNPQPMWVYDLKTFRFLHVNRAAIQQYGYTLEEFMGMTIRDLRPKETLDALKLQLDTDKNKQVDAGIWQHLKKDGSIIYVKIATEPVQFEGCSAEVMVVQDITRQKMAEAEMKKNQQYLRAIFENCFDALFLVDSQTMRIVTCNRRAIELFEANSKDQLIGIRGDRLHKNIYSQEQTNSFFKQVADSDRFECEIPYLTFTGKEFYGQLVKTNIQISNKSYYLVKVTDISRRSVVERKQQENELHLSQLVYNIRDAILIFSYLPDKTPGKFIQVNEQACQVLGYSKEELLTLSLTDLNVPDMHELVAQRMKSLPVNRQAIFETGILTKAGKRLSVEISATILEIGGVLTGLLLVRDISIQKQAEEEMRMTQASFQAIFEESPIGMALVNENGQLHLVNEAYCRMMGYNSEELLQMHFGDFTHPEDLQTDIKWRERIMRGESNSYQVEKRYITKNNGYIWARLTGIRFKYSDQTYIIKITEEITERKKTEIKLRENDRRLQEAEIIAGIGSWETNFLTNEISFSKQFFSIYEVTSEEERAPFYSNRTQAFVYVHPEDLQVVKKQMHYSFENFADFNYEYRIVTNSGRTVHILSIAKFSFDTEGTPIKVSGTIQDITEHKKREEELVKAKQQAEEAALAKQQFLSTMSHELRTPMNAVIGLTHLLLQENPMPEQVENLQMLKFSSESLLALINDILDFSKIEAGKIHLENVGFSMRNLVTSIINPFQLKAHEKGITLNVNVEEQVPSAVTGDPVRLTQILNNLLSNALKFTEKGTVTLAVSLEEETNERMKLHFSVTDTGIGIPADKIAQIFESFSQASNDITRKYGGTGLGLAITKRLLELQGSQIQVKSKQGEGAAFYFSMFMGKSKEGIENMQLATSHTPLTTLDSLRLLLVEDNEINQLIATKFLTKWNIYPVYAINGLEALEKVKQQQYDIILMDLQMPEMNGYEATKAIRSMNDAYYKQIPIIALTADAVMDVKERALAAGMSDFITKPFNPDQLYHKLVHYAGQSFREKQITDNSSSKDIVAAIQLINYEKVFDLARGDMRFIEKLVSSSIEQLEQFKAVIHDLVLGKHISQFESIVHKIQPMVRLFEMHILAQGLETTRQLLNDRQVSVEKLNDQTIELMHMCNSLIGRLMQPLK